MDDQPNVDLSIFLKRLEKVGDIKPTPHGHTLPAISCLSEALDNLRNDGNGFAAIADSITELKPQFHWNQRLDPDRPAFANWHANTQFIGPNGIERRDDIYLGFTLMLPNTRYPEHNHPPEEVYLVLSEGKWRNEDRNWWRPGVGGIVHNRPNIKHALRSEQEPLLAFWLLWT